MQKPTCECFTTTDKEILERRETIIYQLCAGAASGLGMTRQAYEICDEAMPYLTITLVAICVQALAGMKFKDPHGVDRAACAVETEKYLSTLTDDVRLRMAELEAWDLRLRGEAGTVQ